MGASDTIALLDSDALHSEPIESLVRDSGRQIRTFRSVAALAQCLPSHGAILVADEGDSLEKLVREIPPSTHHLPIIAFSRDPLLTRAVEAVFAGADDYLAWPFDPGELAEALARSHKRKADRIDRTMRQDRALKRIQILSDREKEVLALSACGLKSHEIGEQLKISPRTCEVHRAHILKKLDVRTTLDAARIAFEAGLLD